MTIEKFQRAIQDYDVAIAIDKTNSQAYYRKALAMKEMVE